MVCVKSEIYAFWVTVKLFRPKSGRQIQAVYFKILGFGLKQLCAFAHLGYTHKAGTYLFLKFCKPYVCTIKPLLYNRKCQFDIFVYNQP